MTGIIVSIGVSVDSNVVYFEHLKDDVRNGRTCARRSSGRSTRRFSTIIKADLVSLIGAALLYFLTVGPVRGFAFYLGLSTVLDLIASYFFMRPVVAAGHSPTGLVRPAPTRSSRPRRLTASPGGAPAAAAGSRRRR